jgi:hypothetical protein
MTRQVTPLELAQLLGRINKILKPYGHFCNSSLLKFVKKVLFNQPTPIEKRGYVGAIMLNFLSHSGLVRNWETAHKMMNIYLSGTDHVDLSTASYMAIGSIKMEKFETTRFWEHYVDILSKTSDQPKFRLGQLYAIKRSLELSRHPCTHMISDHPIVQNRWDEIEQSWMTDEMGRDRSLFLKKSHLHKLVEEYLTKRNKQFITEHFDMYYIDVAIPESRTAIEIAGPSHFVMPQKAANGTTMLRQRNLEALGWNYLCIPFY